MDLAKTVCDAFLRGTGRAALGALLGGVTGIGFGLGWGLLWWLTHAAPPAFLAVATTFGLAGAGAGALTGLCSALANAGIPNGAGGPPRAAGSWPTPTWGHAVRRARSGNLQGSSGELHEPMPSPHQRS
jgi:hypothetical protein